MKTKYHNWRELAAECQSSGMSINGWCKSRGIPTTTCRQWLIKLSKENIQKDNEVYSAWAKVDLEEVVQQKEEYSVQESIQERPERKISLSRSGWSIEVDSHFDPVVLMRIMKVVELVC